MKRGIIVLFLLIQCTSLSLASTNTKDSAHINKNQVSASQHGETKDNSHSSAHGTIDNDHYAPHLDGGKLSLLWAIPFMGILLSIALFPLLAPHVWHHHYGKISLFWGALFFITFTVQFGSNISMFYLLEVYLLEFIPFIMLLLALYTVAGGIQLKGSLVGSPRLNVIIMLIGTILASWMGTTGAAMLLIRPLLKANSWRKHRTHVVVFFIFLVANIGGSLTPLGDPPLFLGFLKGVDFFWTTKYMLLPMLVAVAMVLLIFYAVDRYFYMKEPSGPDFDSTGVKLSVEGRRNIFLIPIIVGAVLLSSANLGNAFTIHYVAVPLASCYQILVLLAVTLFSLKITKDETREGNGFNWEPILEVAKLFATIFITMVPPIAMLKAGDNGPLAFIVKNVVDANGQFINSAFFWATGLLSSCLDNAPTYVVFFNTAGGNPFTLMGHHANTLLAISAGAVFMGANTYIGNAPNFMVKSIAEENGVHMPSFFGYIIRYSIPVLIPVFIIISLIFF